MGGGVPGRTGKTALGGILAAGALVMLWLACVAPSGRLGLTAVGGLFPMAATLAAGRVAGYLCWGAASLLGLILLPDKGAFETHVFVTNGFEWEYQCLYIPEFVFFCYA